MTKTEFCEMRRVSVRKWADAKIAAGCCKCCGAPRAETSTSRCHRCLELHREQQRGRRQRLDEKVKRVARETVRAAVRRGVLAKPLVCPQCGGSDSPMHAHHASYERKKDVCWMCAKCHGREHRTS